MGKDHLIRLAAPKTWQIKRKEQKFITKQSAGAHSLETSMALGVIMKEVLNYATTTREVKKIINTNEIRVDGKARKDFRFSIGLFDTIEFTSINEYFRVIINKKGKICLVKINKSESNTKPCKITGKTVVKGKIQLNLYDGKNIIVDKDSYKVGDTLMVSLPDHKVSKHFALGKNATIFLTGGKHIGETGKVEDIISNKIIYKDSNNELLETSKQYAFVIGDEKQAIKLE